MTRSAPGLERRAHRPQHHRQAAQLVQHLRRARAHARALARGEDQDGGSAHRRDASPLPRWRSRLRPRRRAAVTGGQGLEPRFSGPKPDVLPLDDPPRGPTWSAREPAAARARRRVDLRRAAQTLQRCRKGPRTSASMPALLRGRRLIDAHSPALRRPLAARRARCCIGPATARRRLRRGAADARPARPADEPRPIDAPPTLCLIDQVARRRIACARCARTAPCQGVAGAQVARHGPLRLLLRRAPLRADAAGAHRHAPYAAHARTSSSARTSAGAPARRRHARAASSPPGWRSPPHREIILDARLPRRRRRRHRRRARRFLGTARARRHLRDRVRAPALTRRV